MGEAFGYAISTQWPDAPGWLWERSGEAGGRNAMSGGNLMVVVARSAAPGTSPHSLPLVAMPPLL